MTMKFAPKVSLLRSLRGERVNYQTLIGEATDNSFDADARRIVIRIDADRIIFEDDGVGVTRKRIESLFSLGDHGAMTTSQLGRFGIGIKVQAINAADIFTVKSTSVDGCFSVSVNWRKVLTSGEWEADDPIWMPVLVGRPTGTIIELTQLRTPQRYTDDKIIDELALRFRPALANGRSIVLNGRSVSLLSDPAITESIERDLALSGGRSAKVVGGLLVKPSKLWGVQVEYRHRVIKVKDNLGCADYTGLTKMFARVQLSGPWRLGRFKDDLTDEDEREELETAVEAALEPILEKCNAASIDAKIAALGELINQGLPADIAAARPHRRKKTSPDPADQKKRRRKTGGTVDAEKAEPGSKGPAKTRRPQQGRLLIELVDGRNEEDGLAMYRPGRPDRVNLSLDNPFIRKIAKLKDEELAADVLRVIGLIFYEQGRQESAPQRELQFKPFGLRVADLLAFNVSTEMIRQA